MFAFRATFSQSLLIHIVVFLLHITTLGVVVVHFNGIYLAFLILILLISWGWAHFRHSLYYRYFIKYIELRPNGQVEICFSNDDKHHNVFPLSGSLASSYILIIIWQLDDGRVIRQSIFRDMTTPDNYRRLLVWLRCDGVCK